MEHNQPTELGARVLHAIEERGIAPRPRWHFLVREWSIRTAALVALILGSWCAALTLYIVNASWPLRVELAHSPLWSVVSVVPLVWLVLFALALFYSVHAVHRMRRGYRFNSSWLVLGALVVSIFAGALLFAAGAGRALDDYLIAQAPGYAEISGHHPLRLRFPAQGVLVGVVEVRGTSTVLVAPDGEVTALDLSTVATPRPELYERPVRVVGTTTAEGIFEVHAIKPLRGRGLKRGPGMRLREGERMPPHPAY